jgi:hypothetical protein
LHDGYFVGFHFRASRCASAIYAGDILEASLSHLSAHVESSFGPLGVVRV